MSRHLVPVLLILVLGGSIAAIDSRPVDPAAILVADLGNPDFETRESAQRKLDTMGKQALPPLKEACTSANPEIARRAQRLVARIEHRIDNELTLAPTLVELNADKTPLGDVLAELSKQSEYMVDVRRSAVGDEVDIPVTVKTGRVPFWEAVLKVCDAADLQIASVSGYMSPASTMRPSAPPRPEPIYTPSIGRSGRRIRGAMEIISSPNIVLEPRGKEPKRPTAVFGGVLVEAFPLPPSAATRDADAALLQIWPEPKLNWQEAKTLTIERARNSLGKLVDPAFSEPDPLPERVVQGNGVVMIQQANGGVVLINQNATVPAPVSTFTRSPRQALARVKPAHIPADKLNELQGTIHGTVRSKSEPLVVLKRMKPGVQSEGLHSAGVELQAMLTRSEDGTWQAAVDLSYDQSAVLPTDQASEGRGAVRLGGGSSLGIRVSDAEGNEFDLNLIASRSIRFANRGNRLMRGFTFSLNHPSGKPIVPEVVSFWGTYPKPVEVPFALAGVPLTLGK